MRTIISIILIFLSLSGIAMNRSRQETRRIEGTEIPLIKMNDQYWVSLYDVNSVGKNCKLKHDFKRALINIKETYRRHNKDDQNKVMVILQENLIGKIDKKHLSPNKKCVFVHADEFIEQSGAFFSVVNKYGLTVASVSEAVELKEKIDDQNIKRKYSKPVSKSNKKPCNSKNNYDLSIHGLVGVQDTKISPAIGFLIRIDEHEIESIDAEFDDIEFSNAMYIDVAEKPWPINF